MRLSTCPMWYSNCFCTILSHLLCLILYDGGLPWASLVSTLGGVYLFYSYSTNGVGGTGFVLTLNVVSGFVRLVGISTLGVAQYWGCLLGAWFMVASTLRLDALFLIGLDGCHSGIGGGLNKIQG